MKKSLLPLLAFFSGAAFGQEMPPDVYIQLVGQPLHADTRWSSLLKIVRANKDKSETAIRLVRLLDSMVTEDQKWRHYFSQLKNKELKNDTLTDELVTNMMGVTDSLNYYLLKDIFNNYGFPNDDIAGRRGANQFWLLVQHQDNHPGFQDSVLKAMKAEVDRGKASPADYAYLADRVKVNTGQLQIYGTQMQLNGDATSYEPRPVIDPDRLNERRKSVGLDSIKNYIHTMNTRYYGTLEKK